MPILNEIANQWVLFAAVIAVGFAAGWFGRQWLLQIRQKPILARLDLADKFFLIDEHDVARQVEATNEHIELLRSISDASLRAAELANKQMKDFMDRFIEIYGSNLVPELIRKASRDIKNLDGDRDLRPQINPKPAPPQSPSTMASS